MHGIIQIISVLGMLLLAACHETRTEVLRPTTPADDAKPNSDAVPDVYAIDSRFDRVLVLRFKYQTDLLAGMEKMVKENKVRNAVILSAIGSVRSVHYHSVSNREFPSKNLYIENPETAADIVSMNGYIIDGKIHAHMTMTNGNGAFGGHLESGTSVFTFAIVTLGVMPDGVHFDRLDDKTYR